MPSTQPTTDRIVASIQSAGAIRARKMFGEYGVYCDDIFVAMVCDNRFLIKPTDAGLAFAGEIGMEEPYPGGKPCMLIPEDWWEDRAWLGELIQITAKALAKTAKRKRAVKKKRSTKKKAVKKKAAIKKKKTPKTNP